MQSLLSLAPQRLLERLREVMGGADLSSQHKLDHIVQLIADAMATDVCSIYLMRVNTFLELFASYGLNPRAIHRLWLNMGEGVVGYVAENGRPLVLTDIKSHPRFKLIPTTDEERFTSFLGIPVNRGGKVMGVLTLQTVAPRLFTEVDIETLQTVAMVLAEVIVAGAFVSDRELSLPSISDTQTLKYTGISLNPGLACGAAILHRPHVLLKNVFAKDLKIECQRFDTAVSAMQQAIKTLFSKSFLQHTEHREVLEVYEMFAHDQGWLNRIKGLIETGLTAEASVQKVQRDLRVQMMQTHSSLLRERIWDFEDLTRRLVSHLREEDVSLKSPVDKNGIVLARSMGPAELLEYERFGVRGLILEEGLQNAHVSIVARALNIPVVSRLNNILDKVKPGEMVLVDGDAGTVTLRPKDRTLTVFELRRESEAKKRLRAQAACTLPSVTKDGVKIDLFLNAGLLMDLDQLHHTHVKGVGLYRTEIPFMMQDKFPSLNDQIKIYSDLNQAAGDHPLIYRTLDIGGDKALPYLRSLPDENPVLGWRAIRIGLDRPMLLRQQLRALLAAAVGKTLHVMFPMIAVLEELRQAKHLLSLEIARFQDRHPQNLPCQVKVGVMIEVPSLIWCLEDVLPHVDFVSVGSNDLSQFFFAADRTNLNLADRYDVLSPVFLKMLQTIVQKCQLGQKTVTLCGEMAARPLEAFALLMIGYRSLSMAPSCIGPTKLMIQNVNLKLSSDYFQHIIDKCTNNLRYELMNYARDQRIIC